MTEVNFIRSAVEPPTRFGVPHAPDPHEHYHGTVVEWPGVEEIWYARADEALPPVTIQWSRLLIRNDLAHSLEVRGPVRTRWLDAALLSPDNFHKVTHTPNRLKLLKRLRKTVIERAYMMLEYPGAPPVPRFDLPHYRLEFPSDYPDPKAAPEPPDICLVPEASFDAVQGLCSLCWIAVFDPRLWRAIEPHVSNWHFRRVCVPRDRMRIPPPEGAPLRPEIRHRTMWRLHPPVRAPYTFRSLIGKATPRGPGFRSVHSPRIHPDQVADDGAVPELMLTDSGAVVTRELWEALRQWGGVDAIGVDLEIRRSRVRAASMRGREYFFLPLADESNPKQGGFPHVYEPPSERYSEPFRMNQGSVLSASWLERHRIHEGAGLTIADERVLNVIRPHCDPRRICVEEVAALEVG